MLKGMIPGDNSKHCPLCLGFVSCGDGSFLVTAAIHVSVWLVTLISSGDSTNVNQHVWLVTWIIVNEYITV
jgi:hypothetical protein